MSEQNEICLALFSKDDENNYIMQIFLSLNFKK